MRNASTRMCGAAWRKLADPDHLKILPRAGGGENLTVRQLAQRLGGYGGHAFVGTPSTIADQMEEWLIGRGSDGFNVMFPYLPEGLDDFIYGVVPDLQRRGIFRREYEDRTLRENLGFPRLANRFFTQAQS
jgi:alkanesulfonate monooxygenase SsuD/methylene tetrahydromethanopterin reductase-like flavin-dependent oxidoreductase (luciferase family)